jgi:hypothetical protein
MKFITILIILFSLSTTKAQDFHFNSMTIYSTTFGDTQRNEVCYSNSEDNGYSLTISKDDEIYKARLLDFKTKKIHYFKINETKSDNGSTSNFIYEKTEELYNPSDKMFSDYVFDFTLISTEGELKKGQLNIYKNSKKKKAVMTFDIELKTFNSNLFHAFRTSCLHPFEFLNNLSISENGIIINAKGSTMRGDKIEHNLVSFKEINLVLRVP